MEMIKRKHGYNMRIGAHVIHLTLDDLKEMQRLVDNAIEEYDVLHYNHHISAKYQLSKKHLLTLKLDESVSVPLDSVNESIIRTRISRLKEIGMVFTTHRDPNHAQFIVTRLS